MKEVAAEGAVVLRSHHSVSIFSVEMHVLVEIS